MNISKKILVMDCKSGESHKESLEGVLDLIELEDGARPLVDIRNVRGSGIATRLPRDYDGYLLHLSQVETRRDLPSLREEQPWSFIYGITGQGTVDIIPEVRDCLDGTYYILAFYNYQEIIQDVLRGKAK